MKTQDILAIMPSLIFELNEKGCWLVTSHKQNVDGYCTIKIDGKTQAIHKLAWAIRHGYDEMPAGLQAHHLCHERSCCNPEHLAGMDQESHITYHNNDRKFSLGEWQKQNSRPALSRHFDYDVSKDDVVFPCDVTPWVQGERCQVGIVKDQLTYFGPTGRRLKDVPDSWEDIFKGIETWTEFIRNGNEVTIMDNLTKVSCADPVELKKCSDVNRLVTDADGKVYTYKVWERGMATIINVIQEAALMCKNKQGQLFLIKMNDAKRQWKGKTITYAFSEVTKMGIPRNAMLITTHKNLNKE